MVDINYIISKGFLLKLKTFSKKKSFYICGTNKGTYKLMKINYPVQKIIFQHEIKEHLFYSGFINIDRYIISEMNKPYFIKDDEVYILIKYKDLKESNFSNNEEFTEIVKIVSVLHNKLRNINFTNYICYGSNDLISDYKNILDDFIIRRKNISNQKKLSDFDVYYIKNYDYYKNIMEESIYMLEETNINKQVKIAVNQNIVCHGLLKEDNILTGGYISNFFESRVDIQILDLIFLIKRYMKVMQKDNLDINTITEIYMKYSNNMQKDDLKVLYPILKFPIKYIKLCNEYYNKKRSWVPNSILQKMDGIILNNDRFESYIDMFKTQL